jgi:predicted SprT family Zn-dependent metalloprotease
MNKGPQSFCLVWRPLVVRWGETWNFPHLLDRIQIGVSSRMRVSLGRCLASQGEIKIAKFLLTGPPGLLEEVLCHEVAHAAAVMKFGSRIRPHGVEWRGLMRDAGFEPRTRIPDTELPHDTLAWTRRRVFWRHRCPICQASRIAGCPVRRWRCTKCLAAGFGGQLDIWRGETC